MIKSKLPHVCTTIFTVMSALANETGAMNLSQGFPNFDTDPRLINEVTKHMQAGANQYAPMPGLMSLRERIAQKMDRLYGYVSNPDTDITITAGATQAIFTAIMAYINEGDEVILFQPAYDCYAPAISLAGGQSVHVDLQAPNYTIDWEHVKRVINQRTRMIIINTPHNPTGSIWTAEDMQQLIKLVKDKDIIVLSDEVYEHIVFDGVEHESILKYPELAEQSIAVYSYGKTYHNTGWKMGYAIAHPKLMTEFRKVHQFNVFCVNAPMQYALEAYMAHEDAYMELGAFYQEKRDFFLKCLAGGPWSPIPCRGTYFQLLNYSAISQEKDTDFAVRLTKEGDVASIPVSVFYHQQRDDKVLRFCFAKDNDTLEQAAEKLLQYAAK